MSKIIRFISSYTIVAWVSISLVFSFEGNIKWIKTGNAYNILCVSKSKDGQELISIDEAGYWKFWDYTQKNFDSVSKKDKIHKIIYRDQDENYLAVQTSGGIALYSHEHTFLQQFNFGKSFQNYYLSPTKDTVVISKHYISGDEGPEPDPHINNDILLCNFINKEQKNLYHVKYRPEQGHTYNFPIISPDGKTVVAVNDSGSIDFIDLDTNIWIKKIFGYFISIYFSNDGKYLFASSKDSSIKVYNWETGDLLKEIRNFESNVNFYQHSIERNIYFTIEIKSDTSKLKFWDFNDFSIIDSLIYNNKQVKNFTFNDSLTTMLYSTSEGHIVEMNLITHNNDTLIKNESLLFNDLAFQKDKYFSVSNNGSIKVWDPKNGNFIKEIPNRLGYINKIRLSHDNTKLLTLNRDNLIQKWDIESGEEELVIATHLDGILGLSFSPDGKYFASGSRDFTIKIWDSKSGNYIKTFSDNYCHKLNYTYDSKGIVLLKGSIFKLLNAENGSMIMQFEFKPKTPIYEWYAYDFALSPDSIHAAVTLGDKTIKIINLKEKIIEKTLIELPYYLTNIDYSTDGKWVAVNCYDSDFNLYIYIIDAESGNIMKYTAGIKNNRKKIGDICFSKNNKFILFQRNPAIGKLDIETGSITFIHGYSSGDEGGRNNIYRTFNNNYIVCAVKEYIFLLDPESLELEKILKNNFGGYPYITACSIDENGEYLALGAQWSEEHDPYPNILLYHLPDTTYRDISGPLSDVNDIGFSPNDSNFSICDQHNVTMRSSVNGNPVDVASDEKWFDSFCYSNNNKYWAYSFHWGGDNYLFRKEIEKNLGLTKTIQLSKHNYWGENLKFSPEDIYLLQTYRSPHILRLFDANNGDLINDFIGHSDFVHSVFFTKDSKVIVSGSNDATIRFWNVKEGKEICKIQFPIPYTKVQLSDDDKYLLAGTYDGSVIMYDVTEEISKTLAATDIPEQNNEFDFECFPNPFSDFTNIIFNLKNPDNVKISIYNSIGQIVKEITNKFLSEGHHRETFKSENLPSGVYYVKLTIGDIVKTFPIILFR